MTTSCFIVDRANPLPFTLVRQDPLGEGGFGKVYLAQYTPRNHPVVKKNIRDLRPGYTVAIKVIKRESNDKISGYNTIESKPYEDIDMTEFGILSKIKGDFIVKYYGCWYNDNMIYVAMEYLEGHTLIGLINGEEDIPTTLGVRNDPFSLPLKYKILTIKQLIVGLKEIHDQGIAHRDIKPSNIMVTNYDSLETFKVKYIDFGLSCEPSEKYGNCGAYTGSVYTSPEGILLSKHNIPLHNNMYKFSKKEDIWQLGLTIYAIYTGLDPSIYFDPKYDIWGLTPIEIRELVQFMVKPYFADRPNIDQVIGKCIEIGIIKIDEELKKKEVALIKGRRTRT